jgi:hypothetical protein
MPDEMKRIRSLALVMVLLIATLLVFSATSVFAQSGGYTLDWFSIDNGGGQSIGGSYTLNGVIGQADAGILSGGAYTLNGGFLRTVDYQVYLPVVLR